MSFLAGIASEGSASGAAGLPGDGTPATFSNEFGEGSVCLVHRPLAGDEAAWALSADGRAVLEISELPPIWELQIQVRFKVRPSGHLWVGLELRQEAMKLGWVTRQMAYAILKVAQSLAAQRGAELRYTLGDDKFTERPHIAAPIMGAHRMFRSDGPTKLPITWPGRKGTWHLSDGQWVPVERSSNFFDTDHYFTFILNTPRLDWNTWQLTKLPGLGSLDIATFIGKQPCCSMLYDDGEEEVKARCGATATAATATAGLSRRRLFVDVEWRPPHMRRALAAEDEAISAAKATPAKLKSGAEVLEKGLPEKELASYRTPGVFLSL